jgi:hypothetical protein
MLDPKITFLEKRLGDLPELKPLATEGLDLLTQIKVMAQIRDILVHGAISSYDPDTQLLKFMRLRVDKREKIHAMEPEHASIPEILEASSVILRLQTQALTFGHRLADRLMV